MIVRAVGIPGAGLMSQAENQLAGTVLGGDGQTGPRKGGVVVTTRVQHVARTMV